MASASALTLTRLCSGGVALQMQATPQRQNNLGMCLKIGKGVPRADATQGVVWFRKAAAADNVDALFNLGSCLSRGEGVAPDAEQAVKYWRRAAETKDTSSLQMSWVTPSRMASGFQRMHQRLRSGSDPDRVCQELDGHV